jgi:tetratricopeptide (TPR) repeat protein
VYYLQGRYDDAVKEYDRGLAFLGSSDHALRERSEIELYVKLGAAHHRAGNADKAARYFERAFKTFKARVANGADDPNTRYYIACAHALRGDTERALDSLERVAVALPALTRARVSRDPDLESLREETRYQSLITDHSSRITNP